MDLIALSQTLKRLPLQVGAAQEAARQVQVVRNPGVDVDPVRGSYPAVQQLPEISALGAMPWYMWILLGGLVYVAIAAPSSRGRRDWG